MTEAGVTRPGEDFDVLALPSSTTLRFVLLLVLFVAGGAGMSLNIANTIGSAFGPYGLDNVTGCALAGGFNPDAGLSSGLLSAMGDYPAIKACIAQWVPNTSWVPFVVTPALIAVAFVLYLVLARWKGRRSRYLPLSAADFNEFTIDRPVRYLVDQAATSLNAVAFGTRRRPTVRLSAGLLAIRAEQPKRFNTILRHELAHINNGDVPITYATVAMWRVFLAAVLLPEAAATVYSLVSDHSPPAWGFSIMNGYTLAQEVLIAVLVYLTRADILRTRELYADLAAVRRWHADPDAMLKETPTPMGFGQLAVVGIWRTHPSWLVRGRTITAAPDALFRLAALPMFATGLAADIALTQFDYAGWSDTVRRLIIAGLVTGIGGVAIWCAVVYAVAEKRKIPSGWLTGLWLGLGMAVGELTDNQITGTRWLPGNPWVLGILVAGTMVLTAWIAQYAQLVARTGRPMLLGLIPPWLALTFVLAWWNDGYLATGWAYSPTAVLSLYGPQTAHPGPLLRIDAILGVLPGGDATFVGLWWALPLLWLFPLLVYARRDLPLRTAVRFGVLGGLLCCGGLLATSAVVHAVESSWTFQAAESWIVLALSGAVLVTAMAAAARRGSRPLLRALVAAGITGLIGAAAAYVLGSVDGCLGPLNALGARSCTWQPTQPLGVAATWLPYVFGTAILLAAGAGGLAHAVAELVRRNRPEVTLPRHRRLRPRPVLGIVVLVVTIGIVATETIHTEVTMPAPISDSDLATALSAVTSAPSKQTRQLQIGAWLYYGAGQLGDRIEAAENAMNSAEHALDGATEANFPSVWQRAVPAACAPLPALAASAKNYLPVPVTSGQPIWARVVTALGDAASACRAEESTRTGASFLAVSDDIDNALTAFETLANWMGPDASTLGQGRLLTVQGANLWFTVTDYARTRQTATITVQICLVGTASGEPVYGHAPWPAWHLVFGDGRTVGPATASTPAEFNAPLYPKYVDDNSEFGVGDCVGGLIPFDIPATEQADPVRIAFAPHPPTAQLSWRMATVDPSIALGAAQSSATGQFAVTGETIRQAADPSAGRVAMFTVRACAADPATFGWQPWTIMLADGTTLAPDAAGPSPFSDATGQNCRSGSIPFDIPAADKTDPVQIEYARSPTFLFWTTTPPAR